MKTIELTKAQVDAIIKEFADVHDENGRFEITLDFDDIVVVAKGDVEIAGIYEDDYFNGTGAFVETMRAASVEVTAYEIDGIECEIDKESYNRIHKYLNEE